MAVWNGQVFKISCSCAVGAAASAGAACRPDGFGITSGRPPGWTPGPEMSTARLTFSWPRTRSFGQVVQGCPGVSALWADVPGLSTRADSWLWSWQQCWQQLSTCLQIAISPCPVAAGRGCGTPSSVREAPQRAGANDAPVFSLSRLWFLVELFVEGPVEVAGEVALEAAADFAVGLALGTAALDIGKGRRVAAHPGDGDHVQGAVELAVAEPVEPRYGCPGACPPR